MAGIQVRSLDEPDQTIDYDGDGDAQAVRIGDSTVWRSVLRPGWSWEKNAKPYAGTDYCPLHHREYVVSGRIRYRMQDGTVADAGPGDHLVIEPGHAAEVLSDDDCVLIDW
jgi:hypothetical protein